MNVSYTFPATRGIQAGKAFFSTTVQFKYLVRLFRFDDEFVPAQLRAQRTLNETRAKSIADYILSNPDTYVLPAITASCDSSMTFKELNDEHAIGILQIPLDACLLINDGQHRRRGIELALQENPLLADHAIPVMIMFDQGLAFSQQVFSDINSRASKPSGSLNALYDLRNPFARWILDILDKRPAYKARIDMENASPGKKSSQLWSLVAFHAFVNMLTGVNEKNIKSLASLDRKTDEVLAFLDHLNTIPLWSGMLNGEMSAEAVRDNYIISHAVFLHALAILGSYVSDLSQLDGLAKVDPSKASDSWKGRSVVAGKMIKTTTGVKSTAAQLMNICGLDLPEDLATINALCEEGK
jgi:DNA sulfur modification protein DndB